MQPKDQLQAVWFAAGMAVVIACIERAVVLSIVKQWRVWVFLALNLLLVAILFTSTHPPRNSSKPPPKSHSNQENGRKTTADDHHEDDSADDGLIFFEREDGGIGIEENDQPDDEKSSTLMSDEELNERVEAFISRFRQQYLVSDVKVCANRSLNVSGDGVLSKTITV